ncbi:hypothetical protein L1987_49383 [Smallanthus sonchifolius]|uniref:Uncharacterized protein n=1 Tax=Smallanthus sonchifolius TaxID=185202 RepID=A0ACB9FVL7_9ASTR|nr:hypothetical protein L1987_49383 [Smallanthus sonchifolius]
MSAHLASAQTLLPAHLASAQTMLPAHLASAQVLPPAHLASAQVPLPAHLASAQDLLRAYLASAHDLAREKRKVKEIVRDIMFSSEYIVDRCISDLDQLTKFRDELKSMMKQANEGRHITPVLKKNDFMSSLLGYEQPSDATVRAPTGIRNKGRGSHKRIKYKKEQAISRAGKRRRECQICFKTGHDRRIDKE